MPDEPTHRSARRRRPLRGRTVLVVVLGLLLPSMSWAAWAWGPTGRDPHPASAAPPATGVPTSVPRAKLKEVAAKLMVRRGRTFQVSRSKRCELPEPRTIRVLTYNIHFAISDRGVQLGRIADELRAWHPDVIALQEVDFNRVRSDHVDQAEWLADQLGMTSTYAPAEVTGASSYGNAILSDFPVVSSEGYRLPATGSGLTNPRVMLRTVVDVDGFELTVDSTHFSNTSDSSDNLQARRVVDLATEPRIVMGDLNSSPHDPAYAILRTGLTDAWDVVGVGAGRTYPTWSPVGRIDYVLYDGELRPLSAEVLRSSVSDHSALLTRFELQPPCR